MAKKDPDMDSLIPDVVVALFIMLLKEMQRD